MFPYPLRLADRHRPGILRGQDGITCVPGPGVAGVWTGRRAARRGLLFNAPVAGLLSFVVGIPMAYSFWLSVHQYDLQRPQARGFVWLQNYTDLLTRPDVWSSFRVTLVFAGATVSLTVVIGLILALLANSALRGRTILRTLLVLPLAIPAIVNGLMWQWMFNGQVGIINAVLLSLNAIDSYRSWLSEPVDALVVLIFAHVWNFTPFSAIFLLAALQSIPLELHEAAAMDGAGQVRRFRHIVLPWLFQPLLVVTLLEIIYSLRVFDLVYVLTGGGPGSATNVMSWAAYHQAFTALRFGSANAYAYLIAGVALVPAVLYMALLFRRGEVEA